MLTIEDLINDICQNEKQFSRDKIDNLIEFLSLIDFIREINYDLNNMK